MIKDLRESNVDQIVLKSDVCIVGAGTAGIFLGQQLRQYGLRVLLLERGDQIIRRPSQLNEECLQAGISFKGAELGRGFGLGGTSALWGGQMIPLAPSDLAARTSLSLNAWPISYSEIIPYIELVRQKFSLDMKADADNQEFQKKYFSYASEFGENFRLRVSEWLPFKTRNFSQAFSKELNDDPQMEVWLNSTVTQFKVNNETDNKYIQFIKAKSSNEKLLRVESKFVVICAGTLESTRLLLALDEANNNLISKMESPIGRYFNDHLSMTCGKLKCHNWHHLNSQIAPVFSSGLMRSPRLEITNKAQDKYAVTSAFIHFPFVTHGDTGFDLVRNFLRKRQGELNLSSLSSVSIGQMVHDLFAIALWKGLYHRLWIPRQSDLLLQIDIEQIPNWNSRLYLSSKRDGFGQKKLVIDWQITSDDLNVFQVVANLARNAWYSSRLQHFADLELALPEDINMYESLYDVYHPTGSLRMGTNHRNSVVNSDLKSWALDNCFISSTAVFPTAGSANPGLTHLAFTARLAEHIHHVNQSY